jgi:hypothetical protein
MSYNMGKFRDRTGKVVKHGDVVKIETTYSGIYGQGQKCRVIWDEATGQYLYEYRVGGMTASTNFDGVADFIKVHDAL